MITYSLFPTPISFFKLDRDISKKENTFLLNLDQRPNKHNTRSIDYNVLDNPNLNLLSEDLKFTLDEREIEIIKYSCTDLIYPAIAHKMKVTVKSLDHRRQVLFKKLHINNRASMVFFALQNGIVDVEDKNLYLQHI
jgi:DNA-binding NarL/FixJ family response regulator